MSSKYGTGCTTICIEIHLPTLTATLPAEGLITETECKDTDAVCEAAGRFVMRHCQVGRLLRAEPEPAPQPRRGWGRGSWWSPTSFSIPPIHGRIGPWRPRRGGKK
jgi:hypothetical protein